MSHKSFNDADIVGHLFRYRPLLIAYLAYVALCVFVTMIINAAKSGLF